VRELNRKVLVILVALMAVAMLATPLIGTAEACIYRRPCRRPVVRTLTLTGTFDTYGQANPPFDWGPYATTFEKGDKLVIFWKGLPVVWGGDIVGSGTYSGIWEITNFGAPDSEFVALFGIFTVKDGWFKDVGTGNLVMAGVMGSIDYGEYAILCGTGALLGARGTMRTTPIGPATYLFTMEIKVIS
jgi:hypothetical protein